MACFIRDKDKISYLFPADMIMQTVGPNGLSRSRRERPPAFEVSPTLQDRIRQTNNSSIPIRAEGMRNRNLMHF